ncbi:O-antigen polysaccharide polymerase Wzy [Nonlabens sp. YIK11]|uniref:O-antigen polysaccharide polymerase Wzy n=1 Tax=Nonlabens sp. YIK11 TaxID=1453349 RepID=UPI001E2F9AEF|nr:O-antigen polysaccharide polymerase Wzy [Nonlabens sp. YIK11]
MSTYIVFSYLFFLVAPIVQAGVLAPLANGEFDHFFPYKEDLFLKTNGLVAIFHIVFFLFYVALKGYIKNKPRSSQVNLQKRKGKELRTSFIIIIISVFIAIIGFPFLLDEYARPEYITSTYSPGVQLVLKKILFVIPLAGIVLIKTVFDRRQLSTQGWFIAAVTLMALLLALFFFKNPLVEKRNALGPIYFLLIFLFFPRILNSNVKMSLTFFVIMIVFFPLLQIITHSDYGLGEMIQNPSLFTNVIDKGSLSKGFMSLNYDAFCNIGIVIEIVEQRGLFWGEQLLSAFLFFIPRGLWPGKPDSSGLIVGNYLIEDYDYYFANLSNPLVSEGYMNFGIVGVVIMAIALAVTIVYFMTWLVSNDVLKRATAFYFAVHLLFLLRGDFTNGYSYFVGTLIGLYILPKLIIYTSSLFIDSNVWIQKKA